MAFNQASLLIYVCVVGLSYFKHSSSTIVCDVYPEKPIVGQKIEFNCKTTGPASDEATKLTVRNQQTTLPVTRTVGGNGELIVTYIILEPSSDDEIDLKCREKVDGNITDICTKTIPMPIDISSDPTSVSIMETKAAVSEPKVSTESKSTIKHFETDENVNDKSETQIVRATSPTPTTNAVDIDTLSHNDYYFTTVTYEDYNDILNDEDDGSKGLSLFDLYPTIFWGLVVGLIIIFFVVIIATMCLVFLTQSKRRKEQENTNVPYTGSMEVLSGPFRKPAGAYLDLHDTSPTATPNQSADRVDRACQTLPCNLPWLAIDVDDGYELHGDIVERRASVAGCGNLELEPNVLGSGVYIGRRATQGLTRSESDRRYSAVCRTRTELDPQFYVPQTRWYRHSDHEMYHLQKNTRGYDAQPITTQVLQEPVRRYKRRAANQIGGTRQSRPYSYVDPSIEQLVPPSVSGKAKAGNRPDEYSDSSL